MLIEYLQGTNIQEDEDEDDEEEKKNLDQKTTSEIG